MNAYTQRLTQRSKSDGEFSIVVNEDELKDIEDDIFNTSDENSGDDTSDEEVGQVARPINKTINHHYHKYNLLHIGGGMEDGLEVSNELFGAFSVRNVCKCVVGWYSCIFYIILLGLSLYVVLSTVLA